MATLSDGTTTVTIPDSLMWADEFSWAPVSQSVARSVTGALIIQVAAQQGGRPITLAPDDDASGWVTRAIVSQIAAWAAVAGKVLTLSLRGTTRSVMFRHDDGAYAATPVVAYEDDDAADYYRLTLRFMEL